MLLFVFKHASALRSSIVELLELELYTYSYI